jgi:hypothetical protein
MSFKPFKSNEQDYIEAVCKEMFSQWKELLDKADIISILLWTSDGSEILEYKGNMDETFEWAKYIGGANPRMGWNEEQDPKRINLHATYYLYTEEPPSFTYGQYKRIIEIIKRIGYVITGKPIRVGATFDPGPEFAKSDFKYCRHNEICVGESMGKSSMVCCYARLQEDKESYAAYPQGIPEGTPFGTFFGRQSQIFMRDMGFDYLWLSNGFGFGTETWGMIGATFDREHFYEEKMEKVQDNIIEFWKLFRRECNYRVETRGTNMTLGVDLASDAVNLKNIYQGGFDILPPCNSPWAAINGDYGIELAGYLSRMAELPVEEEYIYRFYVHDPWWMNSPWLDRYERQPHDIYLPLATARIDKNGEVSLPSYLSFLTIDNCLGDMPRQCPNEIIPHILEAMNTAPDGLAPLIWVYPFREYNDMLSGRASKAFFEDMYMRGAINHGLPLSMVVSTDNFIHSIITDPEKYMGCVLVLPVPVMGEMINSHIIYLIERGQKVLLYGSLEGADNALLKFLGLRLEESIEGEMELSMVLTPDVSRDGQYPKEIRVNKVLSDGGMNVILDEKSNACPEVLARIKQKDQERIAGIYRALEEWQGGAVVWLRGSNGGEFTSGGANISDYSSAEVYPIENLARLAMQRFGIIIRYEKQVQGSREPITMISRNENAFYFSGYCPDTTVRIKLKYPLGAPLLLGSETYLEEGCSVYTHPRAWHKECRVFVNQEDDGIISCREIAPVSFYMYRRIEVKGLKNAKVTIFPRKGFEDKTEVLVNPVGPLIVGEDHKQSKVKTQLGSVIVLENITGTIVISEQHVAYGDGNEYISSAMIKP